MKVKRKSPKTPAEKTGCKVTSKGTKRKRTIHIELARKWKNPIEVVCLKRDSS